VQFIFLRTDYSPFWFRSLFFPLNLLFLPLTIAEAAMTWFVATN
jgi:hypothetical protein